MWLKRGSPIIVIKEHGGFEKCIVREMVIENEKIKEICVRTECRLIDLFHNSYREYKITPNKIDSMLVWRVEYNLQKI